MLTFSSDADETMIAANVILGSLCVVLVVAVIMLVVSAHAQAACVRRGYTGSQVVFLVPYCSRREHGSDVIVPLREVVHAEK